MKTQEKKNFHGLYEELPEIDCVVIGVNCSATLGRCLESIETSNYPKDLLNVVYVDGGSSDSSVDIAKSYSGVKAVTLTPEHPTPGLGRNVGWRQGQAPLVMFLDSDTILDSYWLMSSVHQLTEEVGAIRGDRVELQPHVSHFNWIASLEWNGSPGLVDSFGGDVMLRREVLEMTGGYDEVLVGGEDPELSQRVRASGWSILHLDCTMTRHDMAMSRFSQYWKRAYRSGYGFAAVVDRHRGTGSRFWHKEVLRIGIRGGGSAALLSFSLMLLPFSLFTGFFIWVSLGLLAMSQLLLFFPRLYRVGNFKKDLNISDSQARLYAWHCSIVVLPQMAGMVRYYYGRIFHLPLRNKKSRLATAAL